MILKDTIQKDILRIFKKLMFKRYDQNALSEIYAA